MFQVTTLDLGNMPKTEDGSIDFAQDFFGKPTNLTVSGQLENMAAMKERLEENPEVTLLCGADDVCACCPNNQAGRCTDEDTGLPSDKAEAYDRQVLYCCGLPEGTKIRWKDFAASVQQNILSPGKREEICGGCQWNELCR